MPGSREAAHRALVAAPPLAAAEAIRAPATLGTGPRAGAPVGLTPPAIVVLGCRVRLDVAERLSPGALERRVEMGARAYFGRGDARTVIVVSGGRRWGDDVEADAMARELALKGVPERVIVRERCSLSTRDNARFTAALLARRRAPWALLITCPWHMARAAALFSRAGVSVEPVAAAGVLASWPSRMWRWGVERVLTLA